MSTHRLQQGFVITLVLVAIVLLAHNALGIWQAPAQPVTRAEAVEYSALRAKEPIAKGAVIAPSDIELVELPAPPVIGALSRPADVKGRIAARNIAANDFLTWNNTALASEPGTLADAIPRGLRAISLHVSEESGLVDFLRPGDHVDVLIVSKASRAGMRPGQLFPSGEARILLQDVPVLAVGRSTDRGGSAARHVRNVTLAVAPRNAETVALIRSIGDEYLILRRNGDSATPATARVTASDLVSSADIAQKPSGSRSRRMRRSIEVIRGAKPATTIPVGGSAS